MNNYEDLLIEADSKNLITKEKPLIAHDGLIFGNRIAIRESIPTQKQKACVLAEELGHYYTSVGNILEQDTVNNIQQERRARLWAYNKQIGLLGIVRAFEKGCVTCSEMSEYLDVTEDFFTDAIEAYRLKYGICAQIDNYVVYFEPHLGVVKKVG